MSQVSDALQKMNLGGLLADGLLPPASPSPAPWEPPALEELQGVFPRLEIVRLIGRGGMGAVYEARQVDLERHVAIKVLPVPLGASEVFAERFRREARALGRLRHPHILEVHEFGESTAGHLYFTMEYLPGGDLGTRLKNGPLSPVDALRIVKEICSALEAAHAQGVIHRDIKPTNILLTAAGAVKVADFGLAVLQDRPQERFTHTGLAMGTFEYASPEQVSGTPIDSRSDLYSVGVLCYELLTGKLPRGVFDPPSSVAAVNPRVDAVVQTAMQNDPARRFQSAADLRTALHRSEGTTVGGLVARHRRWIAAALLALFLIFFVPWAIERWRPPAPLSPAPDRPARAAAPAPLTRPPLPEEVELERLFAVLERPNATAGDTWNWVHACEVAGLALTRLGSDDDAYVHYTAWISRLEQKRAIAPNDRRWMITLATTLERRGNVLQGPDPSLALTNFEMSMALTRTALKAAPGDLLTRDRLAKSLCKVLDAHREVSPPSALLARCQEVISACADLPDRREGEDWFDQYLGTCCANSLADVQRKEPSLRPRVQSVARDALRTLFERPGANSTSLNPIAATALANLQALAQ